MCAGDFFEPNRMSIAIKLIVAELAGYGAFALAAAHTGNTAKQKIAERQAQIKQDLKAAK